MRKIYILIILSVFVCNISAQTRTITGIVQKKEKAIPGATVIETGTNNTVITDADGRFSITVSDQANSLTVSNANYVSEQIMLDTSDDYNIRLSPLGFIRNKATLPNRFAMNPALRPIQGYIGVPFLNNIRIDARTNTFNLDHLTFRKNNELVTFMHPDVGINEFLNDIKKNNYLSADFDYSLFTFGFYTGKSFWSFDAGVKAHADGNVPKSLFRFAKVGLDSDEAVRYNFKETQVTGNAYGEVAFGYSRSFLEDNLIVGLRTKFLVGFADFDFKIQDLSLDAELDQWIVSSRATLKASAPGIKAKYDSDGKFDGIEFDDFDDMTLKPGYGLGFDIGASYALAGLALPEGIWGDILSRFTFSGALTDIGFIRWPSVNTLELESVLDRQVVTGDIEIDYNNSDVLEDQLNDIKDNLEDILDLKETGRNRKYTSSLRMKMNLELEYEFFKDMLYAGLLSTTYFNSSHTVTELTLTGTYRPARWFAVALSYSFIHSKFNTFGAAIHLAPKSGISFFLSSDYIVYHVSPQYIPVTTKGINLNFGLNIPIGKRRIPEVMNQ
ncbi:MAG: DUF5723 family protein [Bacteroidales bacterium]|jgi:hypothetical protein|nr:DUF5723 family protein [Bacteroidales bacterium]